jgi:hypothetical protein
MFVDDAERSADDHDLYGTDLPHALSAGIEGIGYIDSGPGKAEAVQSLEKRLEEDFGFRPPVDEPPYTPTDEVLGAVSQALLGTFFSRPPHSSLLPKSERFVAFFRCVFGNPFRPVTFSPSWLTPTVTALATGIYADRAFDRLPILADALQEAGCEDEQVLAHCRGDGPHARGCWVVDGVLGKV